jgi:hypothetical protein
VRRYPIDALLALTDMPYSTVVGRVNSEAWNNMRALGLTPYMADKLAVKCGFHPSLVWPSWWDDEIAEFSLACPECDQRFMPSRPTQKFCCPQHRNNYNARSATRRGLPTAKHKAEYRRRYYAENREYELARQRRYDRKKRAA